MIVAIGFPIGLGVGSLAWRTVARQLGVVDSPVIGAGVLWLVPIAFARHVAEALPAARHLELDCGHVPQVERPRQTHAAIRAFLRS